MTKIISKRNRQVLQERGHLLVGYLLAGYPTREGFLESLRQSVRAGLDVVEVGFPSRNPVNDGQVLQEAHRMVDYDIVDDLAYWKQVREAVEVPLWVMGYREDLLDTPRYLRLAKEGLVDAFVLPGIGQEQRRTLSEELKEYGCDILGFVNPQTLQEEAMQCFETFPLIYMQLYVGQTGVHVEHDEFEPMLTLSKQYPNAHLFAGFGIETPERVAFLLDKGFDGTVVGTAVVKKQNQSNESLVSYINTLAASAKKERIV